MLNQLREHSLINVLARATVQLPELFLEDSNMKKLLRIVLSIALLSGMFTSCSKSNSVKSKQYVPDDAAYYEATSMVLGDDYLNDPGYDFSRVMPIHYSDNYIYTSVSLDDDTYIEKYDYKGQRLSSINLESLSNGPDLYMATVMFGDDNQTYLITSETSLGNEYSINTLYSLSEETDDLTKIGNIDTGFADSCVSIVRARIVNNEIVAECQWIINSIFHTGLVVIDTDGKCLYQTEVEGNLYQINTTDNGELVFSLIGEDGRFSFCKFIVNERRFETFDLSEDTIEQYELGSIGSDGSVYVQKGTKLLKYDLDSKVETVFMDYNYCGAGIYAMQELFIDRIDKDRIIMLDLSLWRNETHGRCKITVLNRADSNPYAGRQIIDVAEIWGINKILSDGAAWFNRENTVYFAYVSDRYDQSVMEIPQMYTDVENGDELQISQTYICNSLMQDIRNGKGPDVVFGLGDVTQINNDEYLIDLNEYMNGDDGIDRKDFFENAFDAFATNGHQYQIPLSISISGLMTMTENAPANGIGYTYDEYLGLVSDVCNGKDPIVYAGYTRQVMLKYMFASMQDEFYDEEGMIHLNNDKFRELAEYVRDNGSDNNMYDPSQCSSAKMTDFYDIYYDLIYGSASYRTWDVYGVPSFDGRGPQVSDFNTVAITSCTTDEAASWSLIKCMLSEEVQVGQIITNPINLAAFDRFAEEAIAAANEVRLRQDSSARLLDQSDIDRYKVMLLKADSPSFVDTEIIAIINEEIQPYYHGDKSIDDVIAVIEKRCKILLDERE